MLSEAFSASIEMMIWFLFFNLLMWCIESHWLMCRYWKILAPLDHGVWSFWCIVGFSLRVFVEGGWDLQPAVRQMISRVPGSSVVCIFRVSFQRDFPVRRPFGVEVRPSAVRTCLHLPARSSLPRNGSLVNLTRALSSLSRANAVGI